MSATATFIASASTSASVGPTGTANYALPAVDGGNLDLAITNGGGAAAWLSFAANAPAGPSVAGCIMLQPGASLLLTTNTATLAAVSSNPLVLSGAQALAAQAAAVVSAVSAPPGSAALTFSRGTAAARLVWRV